jgi:hypothetical protein
MKTLRSELIRLANNHPEMRQHLVPLLRRTASDAPEWAKGKKFRNPATGNQVAWGSLPAAVQKELRAKHKDKGGDGGAKKDKGGDTGSKSVFKGVEGLALGGPDKQKEAISHLTSQGVGSKRAERLVRSLRTLASLQESRDPDIREDIPYMEADIEKQKKAIQKAIQGS